MAVSPSYAERSRSMGANGTSFTTATASAGDGGPLWDKAASADVGLRPRIGSDCREGTRLLLNFFFRPAIRSPKARGSSLICKQITAGIFLLCHAQAGFQSG